MRQTDAEFLKDLAGWFRKYGKYEGVHESEAVATALRLESIAAGKMVEKTDIGRDDERNFETLCHYFWNLGEDARFAVLVDSCGVPKNARRPMPQTLERLFLRRALEKSELHEVWRNVMEYTSPGKRKVNPFSLPASTCIGRAE